MHPRDRSHLIDFYESELAAYGPSSPHALHWNSAHTQRVRFEVLHQVGPWDGVSVADIGCGLGDFLGFLKQAGHRAAPWRRETAEAPGRRVWYAGYDISPAMVSAAGAKHPEGHFEVRDILEDGLDGVFDYVVASGTFNIRLVEGDHDAFFRAMIAAMYAACRRATAFNFLGPALWDGSLYYGADPQQVVDDCRTLSPHVELRSGYLRDDHTILLHRPAASP